MTRHRTETIEQGDPQLALFDLELLALTYEAALRAHDRVLPRTLLGFLR